ncbi:unnamed protein product [Adineta ricciae]|uniref:SH3 domain-containing protein n=1 Tax=Adineta ricciae TaxID=249248 RepID=A0A816BLQ4_ADIRI|nr:unnamed protein product [Adineta ricciae]CAF1613097.1 unnamed protein product [Adineta ricciae]
MSVKPTIGFDKNRSGFQKSFEQTNESSKRNDSNSLPSQPIHTALALYNFQAQSNRELSFKKGEMIVVKRRVNDDWLEGEHHGLTGIFPVNYVELFPYEHANDNANGEGIVKYDYNPQTPLELQLKKGEKVILLRKLDQNWYEGRVNHTEGIFPGDYVEIITEPEEHPPKQNDSPVNNLKAPKSVLKNSTGPKTASDFTIPMQKCQVLYDYTPQNVDELEIHVGDIINILEKCDDGWYCGIMENCAHGNNMKFGTFPGNYVKILPS